MNDLETINQLIDSAVVAEIELKEAKERENAYRQETIEVKEHAEFEWNKIHSLLGKLRDEQNWVGTAFVSSRLGHLLSYWDVGQVKTKDED